MIQSTINILPLVKRLVLIGIQLIKKYKSIINGLIKTTEAIRQDLIYTNNKFLTIILLHTSKI